MLSATSFRSAVVFVTSIYSQTSIIRGFWGQNLVRPTYMKYSKTSIIRGFWGQNLVRPTYMKYNKTSIIRGTRLSAVFEAKT